MAVGLLHILNNKVYKIRLIQCKLKAIIIFIHECENLRLLEIIFGWSWIIAIAFEPYLRIFISPIFVYITKIIISTLSNGT